MIMEKRQKANSLEDQLQKSLDRRRNHSTLRNLSLSSVDQVDFSSNDFLSLSRNPKLKAAYLDELRRVSTGIASGGSRLLDGNSVYAEELERDIATFHGAETGLLFNSGFDANSGFFACVPQPGDIIVYDELIHASVHDGMRLSRAAKTISFPHNSINGLREILERLVHDQEDMSKPDHNVFVAVEAVYSMDGDVAKLKEIVEVVEELLRGGRGYIVVDEAHSTGVIGPYGKGLVCELGLENRIFARLHTFGKALASNGAIILGSPVLRHYLINYARSLIYTTSLSFPALALIRSSYSLLWSGHTETLQRHLHSLTNATYKAMKDLHSQSAASRQLLRLPEVCPDSSIFAIQTDNPRSLATFLQARKLNIRPVVFPTVPLGTQRIRLCLHAGNAIDEVEMLVQGLREWCEANVHLEQTQSKRVGLTEARL